MHLKLLARHFGNAQRERTGHMRHQSMAFDESCPSRSIALLVTASGGGYI